MDVVVFVCNVRIQNLNRSIVCRPLTLNILDTDSVLFVLYFFFYFGVLLYIEIILFLVDSNKYLSAWFDSSYNSAGSFATIIICCSLLAHPFEMHYNFNKKNHFFSSFRYTYKCIVSYSYSQIVFYSNNLCSERIVTDSDPSRCIYLSMNTTLLSSLFFNFFNVALNLKCDLLAAFVVGVLLLLFHLFILFFFLVSTNKKGLQKREKKTTN